MITGQRRDRPRVSVLVPVHNAAPYLARAIESVLRQSFADFELLAVDDGSSDESPAILRDFARRDGRIKVISRANTGIVGALNDGLEAARGELIARMDADDISLPTRFASQVDYLEAHPAAVAVGTGVRLIDADGDPVADREAAPEHEQIEAELLRGGTTALVHATAMMRTAAVARIGGYRPFDTSEDLDLLLRLAEVGRLGNLPEVLYLWRQHPVSSTAVFRRERLRQNRNEIVRQAHQRRGLPLPVGEVRLFHQPASSFEFHRRTAYTALYAGNAATARKHLLAAMRLRPLHPGAWRLAGRVVLTGVRRRIGSRPAGAG